MTQDREVLVAEVARIARQEVAPGRPGVWQVVMNGGSWSFKVFPDRGPSTGDASFARFDVIRRLEAHLREPGDDRTLVVEVAVDGRGGAEFAHAFAPPHGSADSVVLDPEYRHPGHPLPGMSRPPGTTPTDEPTDPVVLRRVAELLTEFRGHHRRLTGRDPEFGTPCTEEALVAAEREMGLRLPEDVRALYLLIGDDLKESGLLDRYNLLPLNQVVSGHLDGVPGAWGWSDGLFDLNRVVLEAQPWGAVRAVSRSDWWVVVFSDFAGNSCAVDLDPGPAGRSGQLIAYGRDYFGPVGYVAESVTAQLTAVVAALRRDAVHPSEHDGPLVVDLPDAEPPYDASIPVEGRDLAPALAELPHRAQVQQLYLNDAETLDLRALSETPRARVLNINRAGRVELHLPESVEGLSLEAREADLTLLAGHPALWDLTVKRLPVRVSDLAALPALSCLDLSEAEVDDVAALADLDVRVLTLSGEQWAVLRAAGRVPARLAGARRAGNSRVSEVVDWSNWLVTAR
ncbi:SMI1/KNR4 family protein [Saccharothrix variisporea]|uniref:Cell wall assembly regulator SMI1 n=1 Tax=Saccharothrix variisporea TaxID=543527 RepID=A0A495WZE3_9PSEU|nr:SMI1/KNR4 family protein [Saccharothrix variisporea]RKT67017.1 cell wall assembly regulator SMI1 [Saccharothrix variisporea]